MKILCLGDSITYGTGGTEGNLYPDVLKRFLEEYLEGVIVVCEGKPGYSTKVFWEFMNAPDETGEPKNFLTYKQYDVVIIMLGSNDIRLDNWVENTDSMRYLNLIVDYTKSLVDADTGEIFICSILPLADPMPPDILGAHHGWKQSRVYEEFNPSVKQLAKDRNIHFIDVYTAFRNGLDADPGLYDGIHPYDSGYALIGNIIGTAAREVLL
jgi:lysophospholipase L1-like esterase